MLINDCRDKIFCNILNRLKEMTFILAFQMYLVVVCINLLLPITAACADMVWDTDQVLGQNGNYDFAGIYEFDNLAIGDDVEITSSGISQLVLQVHGTLTIGANVVIRVRNGFYPYGPKWPIANFTLSSLENYGIYSIDGTLRLYPLSFGNGGDGGNTGYGTRGRCSGDGQRWDLIPCVSGGGGGYGGGVGFTEVGDATTIGEHGNQHYYTNACIEREGDGNGGNGYRGGGYSNCSGAHGGGGGGGGYGGGVLSIGANSIILDNLNPPRFLVSGERGGLGGSGGSNYGEGSAGEDGEGGLLIINCSNCSMTPEYWNLGTGTYGAHTLPSTNGGHGIQTGNPQKIFTNGYEPRVLGQEEIYGIVSDLTSGTLLDDVTVSIDGTEYAAQTLTNGSYGILLDPGSYDVTFSKSGYQSITLTNVVLSSGQATTLNSELTFPGPINITTTTLLSAGASDYYLERVRISGGMYPYEFHIVEGYGLLPPGLSLDPETGTLIGVPTALGTYTFSVGITDSTGGYAEREFSIEVAERLRITTENVLTRGTRYASYSGSIEASGGTLPYSFELTTGSLPNRVLLSSDGSLLGTTYYEGSYGFTVRVTDASGRAAEKSFVLDVDPTFVLSTTRLPDGIVDNPYSFTLEATGGYGEYTWAVFTGQLPTGLIFDSATGEISGTPLVPFYGSVVFSVADEDGRVTYKDLTIQVVEPLVFSTTSMPNGLRDSPYDEALRITGGVGPFSYSYVGQLPAGLTLNTSTGVVSGTPTLTGYTNVQLTVTDSTWPTPQTSTQTLGMRVTSVLTILTSGVFEKAKVGETITPLVLSAAGGPSPYTWAQVGGFLPEGITLDPATGTLSGTPLADGDYVFTLEVTDSTGATATKEFFWHVSDTLRVATFVVPDAALGEPYNVSLAATGGLPPYSWRQVTGTLPAGLSFNTATGTLSGTPTATQTTTSFTVEVIDADSPAQTAQRTYTMQVLDELVITTASLPNGRQDEAYGTTVHAALGSPPYSWRLESGTLPPGVTLTDSPTVATLEGMPSTPGSYPFTLEVSDSGTPVQTLTQAYTVEIYSPVVIETTGLVSAYRGIAYSDDIVVSGGALPHRFQLTSGSLPKGLVLNPATGRIEGTPDEVVGHASTFVVRVADSGSPQGFATYDFVLHVIDPIGILTDTLQGGKQGNAYVATLQGTGGVSPRSWSVTGGGLPDGLTLAPDTGILAGTPSVCGSFPFTVTLSDAAQLPNTVTHAYSLDLECQYGTLTVTLDPPQAVTDGAKWSVDGGTSWKGNGWRPILPVGTYTVTYKDVWGWTTPNPDTAVVTVDATTTHPATYAEIPPVATLTGVPTGPNPAMNLLVTVGGTGVVAYQYALDGDLYGAVTPVETQIRLMDLTPGPHNLHVVGWNTSGTMQGVPTEQRWDLVPGLGLTSLYELLLLQ